MLTSTHIIAVDWGTSYLRAYLCQVSSEGKLTLIERAVGLGVSKVNGQFEAELFSRISPWTAQYGNLPILMAGHIGSSLGWQETKYLPCPAKVDDLASTCLNFISHQQQISIVSGLSCHHKNGHNDVMRGEEVQVMGWLAQNPSHQIGTHLICLPGTHTKWVLVKDGRIELFKTAMTGELFDLLCNHSVLIQPNQHSFNAAAFELGAKYTLESKRGNFTHGLFSVRTKQLFNELAAEDAPSYLSGILIGSDVRAAINADEWQLDKTTQVAIIGSKHLSEQFATVLNHLSISSKQFDVEQCSLHGFANIVKHLRLSNE